MPHPRLDAVTPTEPQPERQTEPTTPHAQRERPPGFVRSYQYSSGSLHPNRRFKTRRPPRHLQQVVADESCQRPPGTPSSGEDSSDNHSPSTASGLRGPLDSIFSTRTLGHHSSQVDTPELGHGGLRNTDSLSNHIRDAVQSLFDDTAADFGSSDLKLDLLQAFTLEASHETVAQEHRLSEEGSQVSSRGSQGQQSEDDRDIKMDRHVPGKSLRNARSFNETPRLPPLDLEESDGSPTRSSESTPTPGQHRRRKYPNAIKKPSLAKLKDSYNQRKATSPHTQGIVMDSKGGHNAVNRWALPEHFTGLLNKAIWSRVEADEMLSPWQIEEYKMKKMAGLRPKTTGSIPDAQRNSDTVHFTEKPSRCSQPIIPLRDGFEFAGGPETQILFPTISIFDDVVKADFSMEGASVEQWPPWEMRSQSPTSDEDEELFRRYMPVPSPMRGVARRQNPSLPSIPEASSTKNEGDGSLPDQDSTLVRYSNASSDLLEFESPPSTMVAPLFRHGPIRISRPGSYPSLSDSAESQSWTGLASDISRNLDETFGDEGHSICEPDRDEVEDLCEWWSQWHFEGPGELVTGGATEASCASSCTGSEKNDVSDSTSREDDDDEAGQSQVVNMGILKSSIDEIREILSRQ